MVKRWLAAGRLMIRDMDLEDVAALKLCLLSLGVLLGLAAPRRKKPAFALFSILVFIGTYFPLMVKFLGSLLQKEQRLVHVTTLL